MTFLRTGDWVLVADGEKALFLENVGDTEYPNLVVRSAEEQDNPPDREQATDRPGRRADGGAHQRSALEETDFHRLAKETFADDLAALVNRRADKGRFRRIVLVAAPMVLGEMRSHLSPRAKDTVVAEIAKTLTNHPLHEVEKIVTRDLAA